jgi:hypothetical protein
VAPAVTTHLVQQSVSVLGVLARLFSCSRGENFRKWLKMRKYFSGGLQWTTMQRYWPYVHTTTVQFWYPVKPPLLNYLVRGALFPACVPRNVNGIKKGLAYTCIQRFRRVSQVKDCCRGILTCTFFLSTVKGQSITDIKYNRTPIVRNGQFRKLKGLCYK